MKTTRIIIDPTQVQKKQFKIPGQFVRVVSGGWPSFRIHFSDSPNTETFNLESSDPLVNGGAYGPKGGRERFDSFWVTTSTLQVSGENLVLDVIDCAEPVYVLNNKQGAGWRFHHVAGTAVVEEITAGNASMIYVDNLWGSTGTVDDQDAFEFVPRGYIGGGISADGPFVAFILQHLNKNGTQQAELARFTVDTPTYGGAFTCSFESGGGPAVDSAMTIAQNGAQLIPWPLFGMRIILKATGTPDIQNYTWLLYSRGALN